MGRSRSRSSESRERYRRKRSRSRSDSRERRRRSRSRERPERSRFLVTDLTAAQQALIQQNTSAQTQTLPQTLPHTVGGIAAVDPAAIVLDRKQREVYCGNLAPGVVDRKILEEFFNQALSHMMKDPIATPPVININMDGQGRFGFVEFRSRELANKALTMDQLVQLHGRHLAIGRPKGYLEPTLPPLPLSIAAPSAPPDPDENGTTLSGAGGPHSTGPTTHILLSNILPIGQLRNEEDRKILEEEVYEEASKHGAVESVIVPSPPESSQDRGPGRVYIKYKTAEDAVKARKIFHTRTLDENKIKVFFIDQNEFDQVIQGRWPPRQTSTAGMPLPGLYTIGPLVSGVSGLTALNPALATVVQSNPTIAVSMIAGIDEDQVPFEQGWVKLRGFPPLLVTKQHIVDFLKSCAPAPGDLTEDDVMMVYSADDTPLGEAFVRIRGESAKLRLALAKDRSPLRPTGVLAEVLTCFEGDVERRKMSGCQVK